MKREQKCGVIWHWLHITWTIRAMAYTLWQQEMFDAYLYSQICAHTQNAEKEEEKKTGDRNPKCTKEHRIYTLLSCWAQSWANDSILHVCHLENVQINPKQWRNEEATACAPYCIFNRMWSKMCLLRYLCTFFLRRILCWTTLLIFMLKSSHPVLHTTSDHLAPIILRMYGKWDDNRLQAMHCTHVSVQSHCVCVCVYSLQKVLGKLKASIFDTLCHYLESHMTSGIKTHTTLVFLRFIREMIIYLESDVRRILSILKWNKPHTSYTLEPITQWLGVCFQEGRICCIYDTWIRILPIWFRILKLMQQ